jgi:hypothetical protein
MRHYQLPNIQTSRGQPPIRWTDGSVAKLACLLETAVSFEAGRCG